MEIPKIKTISKEELEKKDKKYIIERFIALQILAVEENELIRKQNEVIELMTKKIEDMR